MSHFLFYFKLKHFDTLYHKKVKSQGGDAKIPYMKEKKKEAITYNRLQRDFGLNFPKLAV